MKTIRELVIRLLGLVGNNIDEPVSVKIYRRDADNSPTHIAICPINFVSSSYDVFICIEESQIKWEPFK